MTKIDNNHHQDEDDDKDKDEAFGEECPKITEIAVGKNYESKFEQIAYEDNDVKTSFHTPWLDENVTLQTQIKENKWLRWDGAEGTAESHMKWMLEQAKSFTSEERESEFRSYGSKKTNIDGTDCQVKYYIHDEMTKKANGYGFFKIEISNLPVEPKDMVTFAFDFTTMTQIDPTIVMMKNLKTYKGEQKDDPFCIASYWANAPGFPFFIRDGVDISGYHKDDNADNGTVWQMATSAPGLNFQSQPGRALQATDCYWAYKLEPNSDGGKTTKTTLLCQTILNGYIPKFLSNWFICNTLLDYVTTAAKEINKRKESGEHQKVMEKLGLSNL